jgi:hypothetical protein
MNLSTPVSDLTITGIASNATMQHVVACGNGTIVPAKHLYISTNYGVSYTALTGSPQAEWGAISSDSTGQYLVAGQSGTSYKHLYYSTDSGSTWTQSTGVSDALWRYIICSSSGQYVYVNGLDGGDAVVMYASEDYGASFTAIGVIAGQDNNAVRQMACDSTGQTIFVANGTFGVYKSDDYGATWSQSNIDTSSGQNYWYISCDSSGVNLVAYDAAGLYTYASSSGGGAWYQQTTDNTHESGDGPGFVMSSGDGSASYSATTFVGIFRWPPPTPIPCFLEGTKILTSTGYVAIQDLKKGDLVKTRTSGYKPLALKGHREITHSASSDRCKGQLYVCKPAAYPDSGLTADLVLTGCHSILVDRFASEDQKTRTREINGQLFVTEGKMRLPACVDDRATVFETPGVYTIYHIALEHEDYYMNYGVFANGLLVETCSRRYLKELSGMTLVE